MNRLFRENIKNILPENKSFDIWYVTSPSDILPSLLKL